MDCPRVAHFSSTCLAARSLPNVRMSQSSPLSTVRDTTGRLIPHHHRDHVPTRLDIWDRELGLQITLSITITRTTPSNHRGDYADRRHRGMLSKSTRQ
jgi:hypothetical protein